VCSKNLNYIITQTLLIGLINRTTSQNSSIKPYSLVSGVNRGLFNCLYLPSLYGTRDAMAALGLPFNPRNDSAASHD
jgi:hypothetical protein